jgi:hypothetical protein
MVAFFRFRCPLSNCQDSLIALTKMKKLIRFATALRSKDGGFFSFPLPVIKLSGQPNNTYKNEKTD